MIACKWVFRQNAILPVSYGLILVLILLFSSNYIYHVKQVYYYLIGHVFIDIVIFILIVLHQKVTDYEIKDRFKIVGFLMKTGVISYGVYAWHPLILKYLPEYYQYLWFAFLTTWGISYCSFTFFEEKIIKWNKKYD